MTRKDYIKLARLMGDMLRRDEITAKGVGRIVAHLAAQDVKFDKTKFWFELDLTLQIGREFGDKQAS